jgi:hypothetical protein
MRRKNRSAKMKNELGQSVDHFKRAASIAAQETSATVGPKFYAARDRVQPSAVKAKDAASSSWESALATLTPLVTAATEKAQQVSRTTAKVSRKDAKAARKNAKKLDKRANKTLGRKQKSRSGAKLGGLLLAGAAVGAAGAFVVRKRRQEQWDEYDPTPVTPAATQVTPVTSTTATDDTTVPLADKSGQSGFVTPAEKTPPVVEVDVDTADQTSSAQHTPKVARMASGQNNKN